MLRLTVTTEARRDKIGDVITSQETGSIGGLLHSVDTLYITYGGNYIGSFFEQEITKGLDSFQIIICNNILIEFDTSDGYDFMMIPYKNPAYKALYRGRNYQIAQRQAGNERCGYNT